MTGAQPKDAKLIADRIDAAINGTRRECLGRVAVLFSGRLPPTEVLANIYFAEPPTEATVTVWPEVVLDLKLSIETVKH